MLADLARESSRRTSLVRSPRHNRKVPNRSWLIDDEATRLGFAPLGQLRQVQSWRKLRGQL